MLGVVEMPSKQTNPREAKKPNTSKPGMLGDGTEEQNLNQPGNPAAVIKEDEVADAFGNKSSKK